MTLGHLNPNGRSRIVRRAFSILVLVCGSACAFGAARCALSQSTGADGGAKMRDIKPFIAYSETFQWSAVPEILLERFEDAHIDVDRFFDDLGSEPRRRLLEAIRRGGERTASALSRET